jgi:hypothetical protein
MSSNGPFREVQASRLAFPVPSSGPAEHGTRGPGVTVSIALASFPSMRWRCCLCCTGVIALVALASVHWQCCLQHIVLAELAFFASAALAFLLALHWGWHSCCAGHHHIALTFLSFALAPPPELRWRLYPHAGVLLLRWRLPKCDAATHCCHRAGVFPMLRWRPCAQHAGIISGVSWCPQQTCIGVFALFCWRHPPRSAGVCPIAMLLATCHCTLRRC